MHSRGCGEPSQESGHSGVCCACPGEQDISNYDLIDHLLLDSRLLTNSLEDWLEHRLRASLRLRTLFGSSHGCSGEPNNYDVIIALRGIFDSPVVSLATIRRKLLVDI